MKLARRTLQPVAAPRTDDTSASNNGNSSANGNQLVVANKSKNSSNGGTRALSRKTRSAVEAWIEKLFVSDKGRQTKSNELTRRASTGSMTTSSGCDIEGSVEPRAKRRSSFFSSSRERRRADGKENSNSSNAKKENAQSLWLQPVPTFPAIECESQVSASHQKAPTSAPLDPNKMPEPDLMAYVTPPVEIPTDYRNQDRRGGMIVSGRAVLFTNAAFKRKLRNLSQLHVIPENRPAQMHESHRDIYFSYVDASEPVSSSLSADDDDEVVPLSQWI